MTAPSQADEFPLPSGPAWTQPGEWPLVAPALFVCGKIGPRHKTIGFGWVELSTPVCPYKFGHSGACQWARSFAPPAQPRRTEGLL